MPDDRIVADRLHRLADRAADGAPSAAPAEVRRLGDRRRVRRRVGVATGLGLVIVAVAVGPGLLPANNSPGPAHHVPATSPPVPTTPTTAEPAQTAAGWVRRLPDGPAPTVPYLEGFAYHNRGTTYTVPNINTNLFGPVDGGVTIARFALAGGGDFGVLSASGAYHRLGTGYASGMASAPDGSQVAVGVGNAIRVYDVGSGRLVTSVTAQQPVVKSWVAGRVFFESDAGALIGAPSAGKVRSWAWRPESKQPPAAVAAVLDRNGVGLVLGTNCVRVVTAASDPPPGRFNGPCIALPRDSASTAVASPTGRYVAVVDDGVGSGKDEQVKVVDTATGTTTALSPALSVNAFNNGPGQLVWEPRGRLLWVLTTAARQGTATYSMVGCTATDARCAVTLRDVVGPPNGGFFPGLALTPPFLY